MLTQNDLDQLRRHGIDRAEAERQLELFASPPAPIVLDRPATIGDGITRLDPAGESSRRTAAAGALGRVTRFVPASGAATRMFRDLLAGLEAPAEGFDTPDALRRFWTQAQHLPFQGALVRARSASDEPREQLRHLLTGSSGLAELPKGLLPFHRYSAPEPRELTAFEEHIREAAALAGETAQLQLHFTVSPEHRSRFAALLDERRHSLEDELGVEIEVGFSEQSSSTDTLAVDLDGRPVRTDDGTLMLRPGGHGSLLLNLGDLGGDIVMIKNIDNVLTREHRDTVTSWQSQLLGHLVELEGKLHGALARLDDDLEAGLEVARDLGIEIDATIGSDELRRRLSRPLRVCGVVANEGDPGGGPFWVRAGDGQASLQIVESAQVDVDDESQSAIAAKATHFNPVDLVCSLRNAAGKPYDLSQFVDPSTCFLTEKSAGGRRLRALEHPGLWNGSMADWITVFVEVSGATFRPVKTVWDLLRPEHQGS